MFSELLLSRNVTGSGSFIIFFVIFDRVERVLLNFIYEDKFEYDLESEEWCMIYTQHFGVYSKLKKTKLIRIKESLCIFDNITANLPGRPKLRGCSMAWY